MRAGSVVTAIRPSELDLIVSCRVIEGIAFQRVAVSMVLSSTPSTRYVPLKLHHPDHVSTSSVNHGISAQQGLLVVKNQE
jgi:hypothetical protein